ncbi:MAG: metallophosphoesterase [Lewinella sp.]
MASTPRGGLAYGPINYPHMRFAFLFFTLFSLAGQAQAPRELTIEIPDGPTPWTSLEIAPPADRFQFAIVTDRTGGLRPGVFSTAVDKLNLLQPQFVMSVGDFINGYTPNRTQILRQWEEFDGMIDRLDAPFFYVPGNHDLTNPVMEEIWKERFGPTYYHFVYKDVLFLCLNSEDGTRGAGRGMIGDEQFEYVQQTLADNADVRWTFVFLHQPLWDQPEPERWPDVENLLQQREHTVFAGHVHHYVRYTRNNGRYYTLATTGGGSQLRGPQLGEFDHVSWVTMTDNGPVIANIALDGIHTDSLVTRSDYDFITGIYESNPVRFVRPQDAAEETVKLQFHNPADRPAHVRLDPGFSFDYLPDLPYDTVTVPPNNVVEMELTLQPRNGEAPEGASLPLDFTWSYDYEGQTLSLPLSYRIGTDARRELATGSAVSVDGDLGEWADLPYTFGADGNPDLHVEWGVRYTEDSLYLAARVADNDVVVEEGVVAWQQDYLAFIIDAAPYSETVVNTGSGYYENSVIVLASPETDGVPEGASFYQERYDFGLPYRSISTADGYQMEMAMPLRYITERQGDDWEHLRINVGIQDRDTEREEVIRSSWLPDWRGEANVIGSGMFWR